LTRGQCGQFQVIPPRQVLVDLDDLRRDQMEVVEKPFRRRCDERTLVDVLGERFVGALQDARVVAQPRIDAARVAPLRVDREIRREGERPLIEALGAERFLSKWLIRRAIVINPGMEKQA
jgi:hypothetical protein